MIRLNKFLAHSGIASRRKCDQHISDGLVKVNGKVVVRLATLVNPDEDTVHFMDQKVILKKRYIYILLNKPRKVVTTVDDEFNRKTVLDLLNISERIYPVGRLDYETSGALLMTDDGELTNSLLHPSYKMSKKYRVLIDRKLKPIDLHKFKTGIMLDGKKTLPCKIEEIRVINNASFLEIELKEGRNRQIRRMFEALAYEVEELDRFSFAGLNTQGLVRGEWRRLTEIEVEKLKYREAF
jgi:pseudouridine synthase